MPGKPEAERYLSPWVALGLFAAITLAYYVVVIYLYAPLSEIPPLLAEWIVFVKTWSGFVDYTPYIDSRRESMTEVSNVANYILMTHLYTMSFLLLLVGLVACGPFYRKWADRSVSAVRWSSTSPRQAKTKAVLGLNTMVLIFALALFYLVLETYDPNASGWYADRIVENKWFALRIYVIHLFLFVGAVGTIFTLLARRRLASEVD